MLSMPNGWLALSLAMLAVLLAVSLRSVGRSESLEPTTSFTRDTVVAATRSSINTRLVAPGDSSARTGDSSARTIVNAVQDSAALALLGTLLLSLAARIRGNT